MDAVITYRPNTQKITGAFRNILTSEVLTDICNRITGQSRYILVEDSSTYNRGRLLTLDYNGVRHFITLSEMRIEGRNSSLQSVPTALNMFYTDASPHKKLWYYFLPFLGNPFTDYHLMYYRLMLTAGIRFLNVDDYYGNPLVPYYDVDEIIEVRSQNQGNNRSNNSSFISRTADRVQLYAKTYGANKYESTVFGVALSKISDRPVDVFAVSEKDLVNLPSSSLATFAALGNISVYNTSLKLNRLVTESDDSVKLRSGAYHYNLLSRIGNKRCAFCGCEIPEIIQGAHIWSVAAIKQSSRFDDGQKYSHAVSGHNGLWLCQNHHKLFDSGIIAIDTDGRCRVKCALPKSHGVFIREATTFPTLNSRILSDEFWYYLAQRNSQLDLSGYVAV